MRGRWSVRLILLVAAVGALLASSALPAAAHTVGGVGATNFHTTLRRLTPAVPGVSVRVVQNGSRLELRNSTATPVIVRGYQNEPYVKVSSDGVYRNANSPATYLNADRYGVATVPSRAKAGAAPAWQKISDRPVFGWHDHRIHWMHTTLPPAVTRAPGTVHRISQWTVTFGYGDQRLTAHGTLDWIPGPSPWGWLVPGVLLAALPAVLLIGRRRWALPALAAATGLTVAADAVHSLGVARLAADPDPSPTAVGAALLPQAAVWAIGGLAIWLLLRRREGGSWAAAIVGVCVLVASGVPDLPVFWRSSAPSVLPILIDRIAVVAELGLGLGLVLALALQLHQTRRRAPATVGGAAIDPRTTKPGTTAVQGATPGEPELDDPALDDPALDDEAATVPARAGAGRFSRREMVGYAVAGGLGGLDGAGLQVAADSPPAATDAVPSTTLGSRSVPFYGARQAGITTPIQRQAHARIAAFDLLAGVDQAGLRALLRQWTTAAAALTSGQATGDRSDSMTAGSGPAGLTITVGFGPSLFGKAGLPASARPAALAPLPRFAGDRLDQGRSDGDLGLVISADDALVAVHALRTLERLAAGVARPRWQHTGFTGGRGVAADGATNRNLMGQLDGTNNPKPSDPTFAATVFAGSGAPGWMRGGSYLVVRRIRMLLDDWDALPTGTQEQVIGRRKDTGGPLSGGDESTPAQFGRVGADGAPLIPADAHIRLATAAFNQGAAMLRRGYSFADPRADGSVAAGLIFLAWQADPRGGFIPVQQRLAGADRLGRYTRHEASALFAMPGGVASGEYLGQRLLDGAGR